MSEPEYQTLVFRHHEMPMFLGHETPVDTVNRLAAAKFGLKSEDFDPSFNARCDGMDGHKYLFETQITKAAAEALEASRPADIVLIADPLPPANFHFGALDPKDMPPARRKPRGPKL